MKALSRHARKTAPRVACIEWIEPLMAAGNWTPELIEMAGAINLFGEAGTPFAMDDVGRISRLRTLT